MAKNEPQASKPRYRRSKRLVLAGLQLKLAIAFALLACVATVVQALVLVHALSGLARDVAGADSAVFAQASSLVRQNVMISLALLLPPFVLAGVLVTFRIAGPVYRFQKYFEDMASSGYSGPCTIRRGDELQELCRSINRGVERLVDPLQKTPGASGQTDHVLAEVAPALPAQKQVEVSS